MEEGSSEKGREKSIYHHPLVLSLLQDFDPFEETLTTFATNTIIPPPPASVSELIATPYDDDDKQIENTLTVDYYYHHHPAQHQQDHDGGAYIVAAAGDHEANCTTALSLPHSPFNENECIDWDDLQRILWDDDAAMSLEEEKEMKEDVNNGSSNIYEGMVITAAAVKMTNNNNNNNVKRGGHSSTEMINGGNKMGEEEKEGIKKKVKRTWVPRKRWKKGSIEAALQKENIKIRNRVAAAQSFARKQAYIQNLELQVHALRKQHTLLIKFISSLESDQTQCVNSGKPLRRTASGPCLNVHSQVF